MAAPVSTLPQLSRPVRIRRRRLHGRGRRPRPHRVGPPRNSECGPGVVGRECRLWRCAGGLVTSDGRVPFQQQVRFSAPRQSAVPRDLHDLQPDVVGAMLVWALCQMRTRHVTNRDDTTPPGLPDAAQSRLSRDHERDHCHNIGEGDLDPPARRHVQPEPPVHGRMRTAIVENVMTQVVLTSRGRLLSYSTYAHGWDTTASRSSRRTSRRSTSHHGRGHRRGDVLARTATRSCSDAGTGSSARAPAAH